MSHKPGGSLPLLSARPAVTFATLKRAATNFAAWWTEARWVWTVCLRQRRDSDLKPGPSAPESSTLTTRLPSHPCAPDKTLDGHIVWRTSRSFCCSSCSASKLVPDSRFSRLHTHTPTRRYWNSLNHNRTILERHLLSDRPKNALVSVSFDQKT